MSIKIKNDSKGPLHIMRTWDQTEKKKVVVSSYKREGGRIHQNQRVVEKDLHESFLLLPGQVSEELPDRAASEDQIVGLHQSKMIRVFPA